MLPVLLSVLTRALVTSDNCFGGVETFEKLSVTDFSAGTVPQIGVLLQQENVALSRDCANLCKQQQRCAAFALDYRTFRCISYVENSKRHRDHLAPAKTTNLYEKVCLKGIAKQEFDHLCGNERLWAMERVRDHFLDGFVEKELTNMIDKEECAKACLMETSFICRSADFDHVRRVCRLSKENRRTQPQAFVAAKDSNRDYIENQCAPSGPASCIYTTKPNLNVFSMDGLQFATSAEDCQLQCDREASFNCRSFAFINNRCMLSADDTGTLGPRTALPTLKGGVFGERSCVAELCTNGIFTYEKITGHVLRSAITAPVELPNYSTIGVTGWCRDSCDSAQLNCPAFSVNYANNRCERLDRNTQGRTGDLIPKEGESYFEKICLRVPAIMSQCQDKFWAFERVLGYELAPVLYVKTLNFVQSRRDCEEYCLQEREFPCRSALYNDETTECRLSPEDRRTAPGHYYRSRSVKINYLENQCVRAHSTCPYVRTSDSYPTYTDVVETQSVDSSEACEKMCNANRHFLCRSYAYYSSNGQCFLSGDDSTSAHAGAQQKRSSIMYYERQCSRLTNNTAEHPTASGVVATESPVDVHSGRDGPRGSATSGSRGPVDSTRNSANIGTQDGSRPGFSGSDSSDDRDHDTRIEDGSRRGSSDVYSRPPESDDDRNRNDDMYAGPKQTGSGSHDIHGRPETGGGTRHSPTHSSSSNSDRPEMFGRPDQTGSGSREPSSSRPQWNSGSSANDRNRQRTDGNGGNRISMGAFPFGGTSNSGSSPAGSGVVGGSSVPGRDTPGGSIAKEIVFENGTIGGILTTRITRFPENLLPTVPPPPANSNRPSDGGESGRIRDSSSSSDPNSGRPNDSSGTYHPPPSMNAKCAPNARFLFEKVTSFEPIGGHLALLFSDLQAPGIVTECARRCEIEQHCRAFVVDYYHQACHGLMENSSVGALDLRLSMGKDYFEGFCVPSHVHCDKLWPFDRIIDQSSVGARPYDIVRFVSRSECRAKCLEERRFRCLSAAYNSFSHECSLYAEDRNSGSLTLQFTKGVDFIENQCAIDVKSCRYHSIERDISIVSVTKSLRGTSTFHCEQACDFEKEFNCRSYTYLDNPDGSVAPGGNLCLLSADNRATSHQGSMQFRPRALYAEKDCTFQKSISNVIFPNDPFGARTTQGDAQDLAGSKGGRPEELSQLQHIPPKCEGREYSFEKTYGYDLRYASRERAPIPTRPGVVSYCHDECLKQADRCRSFVIEYGENQQQSCFFLDEAALEHRNQLNRSPGSVYSEKICLHSKTCPKLWSFERYIGYQLDLEPDKTIQSIVTRTACQDLCLSEGSFTCRSATFDYGKRICALFSTTRRSKPDAFKPAINGNAVDYFENQCASETSTTCQYRDQQDRYLNYVDKIVVAHSLAECQRSCDSEPSFNCKSVNFDPISRECSLSSEDSLSILSLTNTNNSSNNGTSAHHGNEKAHATIVQADSVFSERGNCEQVSVQCNQQDMLLILNFDSPFHGRVYTKSNSECSVAGSGQTQLQFAIPLNTRCGTHKESSSNYVNEVIVQQHSVIMTDADRTIRVLCSFDVQDQTVTLGEQANANHNLPGPLDVSTNIHGRNGGTAGTGFDGENIKGGIGRFNSGGKSATFVSNTAVPPQIIMRIADAQGTSDAQVVALGDELTLRIEQRDSHSSAFAMFARNLYAKSSNGESLFLIDSNGCPVDSAVFPGLTVDPNDGRSLLGKFKAFRFPSTGVVNFEVQIRFCPEFCEPVHCPGVPGTGERLTSFGRRRRRRRSIHEPSNNGIEQSDDPLIAMASDSASQNKTIISADEYIRTRSNKTGFSYPTNDYLVHQASTTVSTTATNNLPEAEVAKNEFDNSWILDESRQIVQTTLPPLSTDSSSELPLLNNLPEVHASMSALPLPATIRTSGPGALRSHGQGPEVPLSLAIRVDDAVPMEDAIGGGAEFASSTTSGYEEMMSWQGRGELEQPRNDARRSNSADDASSTGQSHFPSLSSRRLQFGPKKKDAGLHSNHCAECTNPGLLVFMTTLIVTVVHLTIAATVYLYVGKLRLKTEQRRAFQARVLAARAHQNRLGSLTPSSSSSLGSSLGDLDQMSAFDGHSTASYQASNFQTRVEKSESANTSVGAIATATPAVVKPVQYFGLDGPDAANVFFGHKEQRFMGINNYQFGTTSRNTASSQHPQ